MPRGVGRDSHTDPALNSSGDSATWNFNVQRHTDAVLQETRRWASHILE